METINGIEVYDLDELVYFEYISSVKGNESLTYEEAKKKLTRGILLGYSVYKNDKTKIQIIQYGWLQIVTKANKKGKKKIIDIKNYQKPRQYWKLDLVKYKEISEKLGLPVNRQERNSVKVHI